MGCVRHATSRFEALGFAFRFRAADSRLVRYVDEVFSDLAAPGRDAHWYELRTSSDRGGIPRYELMLDGRLMYNPPKAERLVSHLVEHVNRQAVEGSARLALHAGGVERDGSACVFPGAMEAGKTTLVAALVRGGFGYLTDEAVAIDRSSLQVQPYPKPLSLDSGSWELFPELEPQADLSTDEYKDSQWLVPATAIRPDALGRSCAVGVVVFPRYVPGAQTTLEPLGRAEAVVELAKNTFAFKDQRRTALDLLAEIVRPAACYRLTMGALHPAVELVTSLAGASTSGRRAS